MSIFLSREQILDLHEGIIEESGGSKGLRDIGIFESCLAQPFQGFGDIHFYPTLIDKACAFGYFLVVNHPFQDGNKRIGHAVLALNLANFGFQITADTDEQEQVIMSLAAGKLDKETFFSWVKSHLGELSY